MEAENADSMWEKVKRWINHIGKEYTLLNDLFPFYVFEKSTNLSIKFRRLPLRTSTQGQIIFVLKSVMHIRGIHF